MTLAPRAPGRLNVTQWAVPVWVAPGRPGQRVRVVNTVVAGELLLVLAVCTMDASVEALVAAPGGTVGWVGSAAGGDAVGLERGGSW